VRPEESDLAHRLQRLVIRLHRELRWEAEETGVSPPDAMVLFDLRRYPGSGVSDLAGLARTARSVISERVKRLQAMGLITKDNMERTDKRRIGLIVTPEGHAVLRRMARIRRNRVAARLNVLDPDERLLIENAVDALDRLAIWRSAEELAAERERKGANEAPEQATTWWERDERRQARQA
jgi:DNA-binding MarR family transcriptional regulator